jgi:hypothetical protein
MRPNEPWASSPKSDHHLKHWRWVRANGKKMGLWNTSSTRKDSVRGHHNLRRLPRVINGLVNLRRADIIHLVFCVASNGQARLPHRSTHPTWAREREQTSEPCSTVGSVTEVRKQNKHSQALLDRDPVPMRQGAAAAP